MKYIPIILLLFILLQSTKALHAQPVYNDGFVQYSVNIADAAKPEYVQYFKDAVMKIYIRGMHTRTELSTALGNTITLFDKQTGAAVVLNEYGDQKMLIRMTNEQFKQSNAKYLNPVIEINTQEKQIHGYQCKHAKVIFEDGSFFSIYFSPNLKFNNTYYGIPVELDGFPLEYESKIGDMKVVYKAEKISTDPVSSNMFDIPESGYREMKYEEMPKN